MSCDKCKRKKLELDRIKGSNRASVRAAVQAEKEREEASRQGKM